LQNIRWFYKACTRGDLNGMQLPVFSMLKCIVLKNRAQNYTSYWFVEHIWQVSTLFCIRTQMNCLGNADQVLANCWTQKSWIAEMGAIHIDMCRKRSIPRQSVVWEYVNDSPTAENAQRRQRIPCVRSLQTFKGIFCCWEHLARAKYTLPLFSLLGIHIGFRIVETCSLSGLMICSGLCGSIFLPCILLHDGISRYGLVFLAG